MNIADRIQFLRKSKGISQEELADKIGVSRQAVSKWESEQSIPDIEKIIRMSDFFDVTTDYLLKGIEPIPDKPIMKIGRPNASIFSIVGTAFNMIGVVISAMVWYEEQNVAASFVGILLLIIGCMIYGIGMIVADKATADKAKQLFWRINIWVITFIPLSMGYNILFGDKGAAPYPVLTGSPIKYVLFWTIYIAIGTICNFIMHQKKQK